MFPDQIVGRLAHGVTIEGAVYPAHAPCIDAGSYRGFDQDIGVTAGLCAGAAMKLSRHDLRPFHSNITGQESIGPANPRSGWSGQICVEVDDLHEPVNTRVGASGAQSGYFLCRELSQCRFQLVLHGLTGELALPALVGLPVVADAEC